MKNNRARRQSQPQSQKNPKKFCAQPRKNQAKKSAHFKTGGRRAIGAVNELQAEE